MKVILWFYCIVQDEDCQSKLLYSVNRVVSEKVEYIRIETGAKDN